VSERLDDLADIVLLTFTNPDQLDSYRIRRALSIPILIDADRSVYRAYGLGRGRLGDVWGWATLRRYAEILRSSGLRRAFSDLRPSGEDTRQLGGDFVVSPDGILAWAFRSTGPADRPDVETIADAVEAASR
jgi:peroxiredoxin